VADVERITRRLADLRAQRQPHVQSWVDAFDLTFPTRAHGLQSQIISATDAQQRQTLLYDSTAPDSCNTGAATFMGSMIPASALWFALDLGEQVTDEERAFMERAARFIWTNIHASNFDAEAFDALLDMMVAGWFVLYLDEATDGGYHFELWPLGHCCISASRAGGLVDTVYREFTLRVHQVVHEYGLDAVSAAVRDKFNAGRLDDEVRLLHCIEPRQIYATDARLARNMPFASVHVELDGRHVLREAGYHEFPCMVPRWRRLPDSAYANGPMAQAIPDARTLNEVVKWSLMGAETAIAPPMVGVDDGVLNVRNFRMGPRKLIVAAEVDNIKPLITGARIDVGEVKIDRLQASIRKILLADQLPPADGPVKTAYEWSVRVDMLRKMLGPLFGRFQAEFLQPLIVRAFGIAWRANIAAGMALMGQPPQSLLNRSFSVRYMSPLARSQRIEEVNAMDRFEMALAQEAQIDQSVLDVYDLEAAARERAHLLGVPEKLTRDERTVARIRAQREQAQAAAQQQALAASGQAEMQAAQAQRFANAA
jgi:hypothetical protein